MLMCQCLNHPRRHVAPGQCRRAASCFHSATVLRIALVSVGDGRKSPTDTGCFHEGVVRFPGRVEMPADRHYRHDLDVELVDLIVGQRRKRQFGQAIGSLLGALCCSCILRVTILVGVLWRTAACTAPSAPSAAATTPRRCPHLGDGAAPRGSSAPRCTTNPAGRTAAAPAGPPASAWLWAGPPCATVDSAELPCAGTLVSWHSQQLQAPLGLGVGALRPGPCG
jgi:hypothetical protein